MDQTFAYQRSSFVLWPATSSLEKVFDIMNGSGEVNGDGVGGSSTGAKEQRTVLFKRSVVYKRCLGMVDTLPP